MQSRSMSGWLRKCSVLLKMMVTNIGVIWTPSSVDCIASSGRFRPPLLTVLVRVLFPNPHPPLLPFLFHSLSFSFLLKTTHIQLSILFIHPYHPFFIPIHSSISPHTHPPFHPLTHVDAWTGSERTRESMGA